MKQTLLMLVALLVGAPVYAVGTSLETEEANRMAATASRISIAPRCFARVQSRQRATAWRMLDLPARVVFIVNQVPVAARR